MGEKKGTTVGHDEQWIHFDWYCFNKRNALFSIHTKTDELSKTIQKHNQGQNKNRL